MGVKVNSVGMNWPLAAAIALIASFANMEASAQWLADNERPGMANGLQLSSSGIPQTPMASSNCWPNCSPPLPPLGSFRSGIDPTCSSNGGPQVSGPQVGWSCAGAQAYNFPSPLIATPGNGINTTGFPEPLAYAANPCAVYSATGSLAPQTFAADPCAAYAANGYSANAWTSSGCVSALPARRFYGGFEFLWMRAHFDQNVAMIVDPPLGNTLTPFNYSANLTPRVWLGGQSAVSGAGLRATYWRFDEAAAEERATAVAGATPVYLFVYGAGGNLSRNAYADLGETLVSNHSLMLHTLDFEGTQQFSMASLQCLAGFGVRIAEMDQHLRGDVYDATNSLWEVVTNDLSFQGAGPTVSLQIQRCLGNSRLSVFNGLRGALLLSDAHQGIYEMKDGFANELIDVAEQTEVLSMGEMALGLQYWQPIGPRAQIFVRGNYECQAWFDVGGPVDSHSTVAFSGIGLATGMLY